MATAPYFCVSPNTLLSVIGLIHGPDRTVPTPAEDWSRASVDVVIPALNEERNIGICLASVMKQTLRPRRIILVDDGSIDQTVEYARAFCEANALEFLPIQRARPIGKTPTIKRQSREFDSDVVFILDGDTVLESANYIERAVQELYQAVGIASACGTVLPIRARDRGDALAEASMERFFGRRPEARARTLERQSITLSRGITNMYRDVLYMFLQKFVYVGQMTFFGSITNPVGCAVAYRRQYVKALFDQVEPILGDDLTNSEDIFIGFSMLNQGYRNIQLVDVYARSTEPLAQRLPRQLYMWSSSYLQSCYYFNDLLISPFKSIKRWRHGREVERKYGQAIREKRKIQEPYRQVFGAEYTKKWGRPVGWMLLMSAIEKIAFPTVVLAMLANRMWEPLGVTLAAETALSLVILSIIAKGARLEYVLKGILVTPIRYGALLYEVGTITRFAGDLWLRRSRKWRK